MHCCFSLLFTNLVFLGGLVAGPVVAQISSQHDTQVADTVWLDIPLHDGDVLVHEREDGDRIIQRHRYTGNKIYWVGLHAPHVFDLQNRSYSISIAANGNVLYSPFDFFGSSIPVEYYPAYIPMGDSVRISNTMWHVAARFDTTIFSKRVRAFSLQKDEQWYEQRLTIADRFGVVSETGRYGTFTLHSAVINGVKYNRDTVRRRIFPLREGSIYAYARIGRELNPPVRDTVRTSITRDTIVDGNRFLWFELPPFRTSSGYSISDMQGWFRETEDGLLSVDSVIVIPAAMDIGDATPMGGVVTEIFRREYYGVMKNVYVGRDIAPECFHTDTLVEGIGPVCCSFGGFTDWPRTWYLVGGIICGEPWGIPLTVSETPIHPEQPAMQLYPNPAPAGTDFINIRIVGVESGTGRLSVYDLLGRELRNQFVNCDPTENEYTVPLDYLPAGMYVVRIRSGGQTMSKNLLLLW